MIREGSGRLWVALECSVKLGINRGGLGKLKEARAGFGDLWEALALMIEKAGFGCLRGALRILDAARVCSGRRWDAMWTSVSERAVGSVESQNEVGGVDNSGVAGLAV